MTIIVGVPRKRDEEDLCPICNGYCGCTDGAHCEAEEALFDPWGDS